MSVLELTQAAEWFIANRDDKRVSFVLSSDEAIASATEDIHPGDVAVLAETTVPDDRYLLVVSFGGSVAGPARTCAEFKLETSTMVFPWYLVVRGSSIYEHQFEVPAIVAPGESLSLTATTDTIKTSVSGFVTGVYGDVIGPAI